jgi:hypothetical protein
LRFLQGDIVMPPQHRQISRQTVPSTPGNENFAGATENITASTQEHVDWRRMVVFSDHRESVASAVITLYRAALATADIPLWQAPLYIRRMPNSIVLYFSPKAADLCNSLFDAFGVDPSERPRNLQAYTRVTAD